MRDASISAIALAAFTMFFATIGPVDVAVIFANLTSNQPRSFRSRIALRACVIATIVLLVAALAGKFLLTHLGVSLAALQASGGVILLLIALDMVFARPYGLFTITGPETTEARHKTDIVVFPLAIPLLAGPGAISAAIILVARTQGNAYAVAAVLGSLLAVMSIAALLMLIAQEIHAVMSSDRAERHSARLRHPARSRGDAIHIRRARRQRDSRRGKMTAAWASLAW